MKIIAGRSNLELSKSIAEHCFIKVVPANIGSFADGECSVELLENVRGEDCFVIQSTSTPVNDNLMELLIMIETLRRASASRITAVIPYFGYARQDRKTSSRTPITARLVANLLTEAGADRILTMDLHAGQIQGFFNIPVDDLTSRLIFSKDIKRKLRDEATKTVFVSPDAGGVVRARKFADGFSGMIAIVDKRRSRPGVSEAMHIIGNVKDKHAILVDDMIDSGGTIVNAAKILLARGAISVRAYITHGILTGDACRKIQDSKLEELVITNSITYKCPEEITKIKQVTIDELIGEAIRRISNEESISTLFS